MGDSAIPGSLDLGLCSGYPGRCLFLGHGLPRAGVQQDASSRSLRVRCGDARRGGALAAGGFLPQELFLAALRPPFPGAAGVVASSSWPSLCSSAPPPPPRMALGSFHAGRSGN